MIVCSSNCYAISTFFDICTCTFHIYVQFVCNFYMYAIFYFKQEYLRLFFELCYQKIFHHRMMIDNFFKNKFAM